MSIKSGFSSLVDRVTGVLETISVDPRTAYLVGGSVRDALLKFPSHDLDFVLEKDALRTARKVANALGGAYYTMDEEFQVGRVVLEDAEGVRQVLDFAALQKADLEGDLRNRDFTINAIAVALNDPGTLIDPLGGVEDLLKKRLRVCSPDSLNQDPVRVIRAVRMSSSYKLAILPETRSLIEPAVQRLGEVSVERVRDEFLKVLDAPKPVVSLRMLDLFGVMEHILPQVSEMKGVTQSAPHIYDVWEHSLHTVGAMEQILKLLDESYVHENEFGGDLLSGLVSQRLGRYRKEISAHLNTALVADRPYRPVLFLAALCHDFTKPRHRTVEDSGRVRFIGHETSGAEEISKQGSAMRLSRTEIHRLSLIVQNHMRPWQLAKQPEPPSRKAVYRFWRDTGPAGVDIVLLALADLIGIYGHTLPQDVLQKHLDIARTMLEAYWETPQQVTPDLLLNGSEMMDVFQLEPGPKIGELLEVLREAQAVGDVETREQAIRFLTDTLADS